MDKVSFIQESFQESAETFKLLAQNEGLQKKVAEAAAWISDSYQKGGTLFIAGNGGSAADAQHIAAEMVGKLSKDRTSLPAYAMTVDSSLLTAVGNDYSYDHIFARQVEGLVKSQDIFWGITTSGNSGNILKAFEACRKKGARSILLSGKDGGKATQQGLADLVLLAPGAHTARIQEAHIAIYHSICFLVEKTLHEKGVIEYF